jgi:hypothetical protein
MNWRKIMDDTDKLLSRVPDPFKSLFKEVSFKQDDEALLDNDRQFQQQLDEEAEAWAELRERDIRDAQDVEEEMRQPTDYVENEDE